MTHVRRPNRRRLPELNAIATGETCPATGKIRYVDRRHAAVVRDELAKRDPDADRLDVYQHSGRAGCGDWHVGHRA